MDQPDSEDRIIIALRRIIRAIELRSRQLVDRVGLTGPQLVTLREIVQSGGATPSALARSIHLSQSTLTGILERLERRGLVTRTPSGLDRRSITMSATRAGEELLRRAPSPLQEHFRARLSELQEWEQTSILATLQRIAAMMDAERLDASAVLVTGPMDSAAGAACGSASDSGGTVPDRRTPGSDLTGIAGGRGRGFGRMTRKGPKPKENQI